MIGLIAIADAVKPNSKAAVAKVRERKIEVVILPGDSTATAKRIAADLGIDSVLAEVRRAKRHATSSLPSSVVGQLCEKSTKIYGARWAITPSPSRSQPASAQAVSTGV